jgi:hypothetical protein
MKLILVIILVIFAAVIAIFFRKKKLEIIVEEEANKIPNFIKTVEKKPTVPQERFQNKQEISEVIDDLKKASSIKPEGNQQRNLDRETGGLENEEEMQNDEKDVWDDRSEEVDKMGAIDQLGSTAKKSMIWRKKKEKMEEKKMDKAKNASETHKGSGKNYDSRGQKAGFMTMVKSRIDNEPGGRGV